MFQTTLDVETVWNGNALSAIVVGYEEYHLWHNFVSLMANHLVGCFLLHLLFSRCTEREHEYMGEWRDRVCVCYSCELPQGAVVPLFSLISLSSTCWTVAKFSLLSTIIAVEWWCTLVVSKYLSWWNDNNREMESEKSTLFCTAGNLKRKIIIIDVIAGRMLAHFFFTIVNGDGTDVNVKLLTLPFKCCSFLALPHISTNTHNSATKWTFFSVALTQMLLISREKRIKTEIRRRNVMVWY